jgi:hypothetical protein
MVKGRFEAGSRGKAAQAAEKIKGAQKEPKEKRRHTNNFAIPVPFVYPCRGH